MAPFNDQLSIEARFSDYSERIAGDLGHADRIAPFRLYCWGLLFPGGRKSVEAMAARLAPLQARRLHQSLHHFVANADWSHDAMLARIEKVVLPAITRRAGARRWIVGEMSFVKKGMHSAGVARQFCRESGRCRNCQVAVTLAAGDDIATLPIAFRLHLPEEWLMDLVRREKAGVPRNIVHSSKTEIALEQIRAAGDDGHLPDLVLADVDFGSDGAFHATLAQWGLPYIVGVPRSLRGARALPKTPELGTGFAETAGDSDLHSADEIADRIPPEDWRILASYEGAEAVSSRFGAARVRPCLGEDGRPPLGEEQWLLVERRDPLGTPSAHWLSNLPASTSLASLVEPWRTYEKAKLDSRRLKEDFGLDHYEGRGWRGFHHHAALCIAAYGFLLWERFSRSESGLGGEEPPAHRSRWAPKHL